MRQIFVDSRDRIAGTSTDFQIQLPETLVIEGREHKARVDNLRIPCVIPTIRAGVNDTIQVRQNGLTYNATIPQANYTGPNLAAAVRASLQAAATGDWTVTYDANNIAMTVSCTVAFTIVGGSYAEQLMSRPYTNTAFSYSFTYVSVLGIDMLYLSSPNFSTLDTVGPGGSHDTLMSAIVTQPFGGVLDVSMPWDSWFTVPAMTTQQLSFLLRDRDYNLLSIVPNISFVLLID